MMEIGGLPDLMFLLPRLLQFLWIVYASFVEVTISLSGGPFPGLQSTAYGCEKGAIMILHRQSGKSWAREAVQG